MRPADHALALAGLPEGTRLVVLDALRVRAMDAVADTLEARAGGATDGLADLAADVYRASVPHADQRAAFDPARYLDADPLEVATPYPGTYAVTLELAALGWLLRHDGGAFYLETLPDAGDASTGPFDTPADALEAARAWPGADVIGPRPHPRGPHPDAFAALRGETAPVVAALQDARDALTSADRDVSEALVGVDRALEELA